MRDLGITLNSHMIASTDHARQRIATRLKIPLGKVDLDSFVLTQLPKRMRHSWRERPAIFYSRRYRAFAKVVDGVLITVYRR
jgi:hypothetical protein